MASLAGPTMFNTFLTPPFLTPNLTLTPPAPQTSYRHDYPQHALEIPCPAAKLPAPPQGGEAWTKDARGKDHVLWDKEKKAWEAAVGSSQGIPR